MVLDDIYQGAEGEYCTLVYDCYHTGRSQNSEVGSQKSESRRRKWKGDYTLLIEFFLDVASIPMDDGASD